MNKCITCYIWSWYKNKKSVEHVKGRVTFGRFWIRVESRNMSYCQNVVSPSLSTSGFLPCIDALGMRKENVSTLDNSCTDIYVTFPRHFVSTEWNKVTRAVGLGRFQIAGTHMCFAIERTYCLHLLVSVSSGTFCKRSKRFVL